MSHACTCALLYSTVETAQYMSSPGFLEASVKAVIAIAGTVLPKHHWIVFSRVDRIQSSKEPVPSTSGLSETAACPPPATANNPSPTYLPPPASNSSCLFTRCQLLPYTIVFFKVLYCKIKNVLFFCLFFMYYFCEKHYKAITV